MKSNKKSFETIDEYIENFQNNIKRVLIAKIFR